MVYAQILNQIVQNTIYLTDTSLLSQFSVGYDTVIRIDNLTPVPAIGWSYSGGTFSPPAPSNIIPPVTPRQMRLALVAMGVYTEVQSAIAALSDPLLTEVTITWDYSMLFERNNPMVAQIASSLGWTSGQLDSLWLFAATL